jgi:hypothetical protein
VKIPAAVVLNIGVGSGFLEQHLSSKGWNVRSLDPSRGAIKRLRDMGIEEMWAMSKPCPMQIIDSMSYSVPRFLNIYLTLSSTKELRRF